MSSVDITEQGGGDDDPGADYVALVREVADREMTLGTAESLTAGLLSAKIADVPGASAVLRGGLVVYATDLKNTIAGVPTGVLDAHGAVSEQTARALAEGARRRCGADIGIGLTGVAGPDTQEGRPAGTVYIGVAVPQRETEVRSLQLSGGRREVRESACRSAVEAVRELLGNESGPPGVVWDDA